MTRKLYNVGVILAAGKGLRMGGTTSLPKQYCQLAGKEVIRYSIERFCACPGIDEVCIVADRDWTQTVADKYTGPHYPKVRQVIAGGSDRFESCHRAILAYQDRPHATTNLIFHDAARPLLSAEHLLSVTEALQDDEAVTLAIPCTDTVLRIDTATGHALEVPPRAELACAQTPQGFRLALLHQAYELYSNQAIHRTATDTCGVVLEVLSNVKIRCLAGQSSNIKLTHPIDFTIADSLLTSDAP